MENSAKNELIVVGGLNAVEVFGSGKTDSIIKKIEDEARSFVSDISTPQGRKDVASLAYKIARSKTTLDAMGKELTATAKQKIAKIDAERSAMRDRLDALKDEVRKPLTEWENKEKDRIKAHEDAILVLYEGTVFGVQPSSQSVVSRLKALKEYYTVRVWEEFEVPAKKAFDQAEQTLSKMRADLLRREAEQAELEKLRKENTLREAREHDERVAREAAERAKAEAEAKATKAAEKAKAEAEAERAEIERKAREEREAAERERADAAAKIQAAEKAKAEAEDIAKAEREALERKAQEERAAAKRQHIADEAKIKAVEKAKAEALARAKQDAEYAVAKERQRAADKKAAEDTEKSRREADITHRMKTNGEALAALRQIGISEDDSRTVIDAIADHKIPNVLIRY